MLSGLELPVWLDPSLSLVEGILALSVARILAWLAWCLGGALLVEAAPERARRPLSLAISLAFVALFWSGRVGACLVGAAVLVLALQRLLGHRGWMVILGVLLGGYLPLTLSGLLLETPRDRVLFSNGMELFGLVIFFKRALSFTWELRAGRVKARGWIDGLWYFCGLPFLLGRAPVVSWSHFWGREEQLNLGVRLRAWAGMVGVCGLHLAGVVLVALHPGSWTLDHQSVLTLEERAAGEVWLLLMINNVAFYGYRYGTEQLSVGALRLYGHGVDDNYNQPLLARSYADFWRRWNIHFRNLMASLFYYPTALWAGRRWKGRPELAVVLACLTTFSAHGLFMAYNAFIFVPPQFRERWWAIGSRLLVYEVFEFALVVMSMLAGERLARRWPWLAWLLGVPLTFLWRSMLIPLIISRSLGGPELLTSLLRAMWPGP